MLTVELARDLLLDIKEKKKTKSPSALNPAPT